MDILEEIKSSLQQNNNLDKMTKAKFFELTVIFHDSFPNVDLSRLNDRLKNLKIGRISKLEGKGTYTYDIFQNELLFCASNIEDGNYDLNNLFMKAILSMITYNGRYTGFNSDYKLTALNEAYTEILANYLIGNEGDSDLEEEVLITNLISHIIGKDTLFDAYFNNDGNSILKALEKAEATV